MYKRKIKTMINNLNLLIGIIITRNFTPLTTLTTQYLINKKELTNKYIHTTLYTIFFITSLLTFPLFFLICNYLNTKIFLFIGILSQLLYFLLLIKSNKTKLGKIILKTSIIIHGISTVFLINITSVIFKYIDDYNKQIEEKNKINSDIFFSKTIYYKKITKIIASLISQTLFNISDFPSIIFPTLISLILGIILSLFIKSLSISNIPINELFIIKTYKVIFTKEVIYISCLHIIESILSLAFIIYSSNIFIERREELPFYLINILKLISKPLEFILLIYLKLFNKFYFIKIKKLENNVILFGYIDALTNISSIFFSWIYSFFYNKFIDKKYFYQKISFFILIIILLFIAFCISKVNSLLITYLLFIIGLTITNSLCITLRSFTSNICKEYRSLLFTILGFFTALIHTFISLLTKKYTAGNKISIYVSISLFLLLIAFIFGFIL